MNIPQQIRAFLAGFHEETIFRATVSDISGNTIAIKRPGFLPDGQYYPALNSYASPTVGDEVLVIKVGRGFVVVGEIIR